MNVVKHITGNAGHTTHRPRDVKCTGGTSSITRLTAVRIQLSLWGIHCAPQIACFALLFA
eukprot:11223545-Lingulodinium_polyedra.AAC.1